MKHTNAAGNSLTNISSPCPCILQKGTMSGDHKKKSKSSKKKASETEEEYVVEGILKKRMENGEPQYFVKWKDWPQ